MATAPIEMFTIGHSNRTWTEFLELLRAHGIQRVIDVRSLPGSRHNPQFDKVALAAGLRSARIAYLHLRKLGGRRRAHPESLNIGWRNASFRGYADYMQTPDFLNGLNRAIKLAKNKKSVLMCAEAVPWRCHRSLIADALLIRGIRVFDIIAGKHARSHSLTPFARLRGKRITYPSLEPATKGIKRTARPKARATRASRG